MNRRNLTATLVLAVVAMGAASAAHAQNVYRWVNGDFQPDVYTQSQNWRLLPDGAGFDGSPGPGDIALFDIVGSAGLSSPVANFQTGRVEVRNTTVTVHDPRGLTLNNVANTNNSSSLVVGNGDPDNTATFNLVNTPFPGGTSRINAGNIRIADDGATGTLNVQGGEAELRAGDFLTIGFEGTGTMTISDGGTVSNSEGSVGSTPGSTGTVSVAGAGSTWTNSGSFLLIGVLNSRA